MTAEIVASGMRLFDSWQPWVMAGVAFAGAVIVFWLLIAWALRKYLRTGELARPQGEFHPPSPRVENPTTFMAASMQGVIQRLREQEKELERLHRLERERAQQTERLSEAVTRNMPTGLLLVSAAGVITLSNPAAEQALGMGALGYRRYNEVLGANSAITRLLADCLSQGKTFRREEIEHSTPDGRTRTLGVTVSPIRPSAPVKRPPGAQPLGAPPTAGALVLLSDLTELTALQRHMRMRENLAALGEMAAGIAHEFKNALATIAGYAQMIDRHTPPAETVENAQRILSETRALAHVVTEFLRYARPMEYAPGEVQLGPLVEQAAREIREAVPGVELRVAGHFGEVSADAGLLRQALLNLLRNAAEAVAGRTGGTVTISGTAGPGGAQNIVVADNGPGIPSDAMPKIFLPFFTTKAQGTGLGLAIVQKIILQHGGTIEARNRPEGGAAFLVSLPTRRTSEPAAVESAPARI